MLSYEIIVPKFAWPYFSEVESRENDRHFGNYFVTLFDYSCINNYFYAIIYHLNDLSCCLEN